MSLARLLIAGAAGYVLYKAATDGSRPSFRKGARTYDGLSGVFHTREQADLAVEHLVQEYGVEPSFIYVEPVDGENSSGDSVSGGDHASGDPGTRDRGDAPLHGAIGVSVPATGANLPKLRRALEDAGAIRVEQF